MPAALSLLLAAAVATHPEHAPLPREARPAATAPAPARHALALDWGRDLALTGTGLALWVASEAFFKGQLAPAECHWCDRLPDGGEGLGALDAWGRGLAADTPEGRKRADTWSNVTAFGLLPLGMAGSHWALTGLQPRLAAEDALIVAQSVVFASVVNQAVKFTVGRERPFVHLLDPENKLTTDHPSDNNLSFYSGHASFAFSAAVSAGTVAELRGYEHRWLVWAVGLPIATAVPLLRMAADKHYLSDVLVGAAVGSAFGAGVPLLLHARLPEGVEAQVVAGPSGAAVVGRF